MARPKKVVEEVVSEDVQTEEIVQNIVQKTVAMVRDETYPEPRSADVHPDEVDEWKKLGWVNK